ncbi:DUF998 domain-containing protein [Nocardioides sp. dk4132]|uniref:DUF998 domain-containing protein n=1 Tax=unclassified Nocardioides TaxID=2615069 RepID=UPI0012954872|nr:MULTISPECIES: DUF998 domain-containing protein [unclassified Nocardioides]MQW76376.1 DUF998 domain-containing protein [Nocardioides sp. dk4132]QGA07348.1 DUF998 domain-containing protein [Nocardioides sp. dk884]
MTGVPRRGPLRPAVMGAGAGVLYANFALDWVRRGTASLGHMVSELAAPGEPDAWVYRASEVGAAVLVVPLLPGVRAALPAGPAREVVVGATAVFAAGAALAALVPTPFGPRVVREEVDRRPRSEVHDRASIVSDTGLYVGVAAAWVSTRHAGPRWVHRAAAAVLCLGGGSSLAFGYARPSARLRWVGGISQRVNVVVISAWLGCLGLLAARARDAVLP